MLIDPFLPKWQSDLNRLHTALPHGASLMLLIDGAFVPKTFKQLGNECQPILLFELLPGCSREAKDVSHSSCNLLLGINHSRAYCRVVAAGQC